jgi:hypothetical protein
MIRTILLQPFNKTDKTPRKRDAWDIIRPIIFGLGLMVALIPTFYPITNHEFVILPFMAVVIFITHLALTLHTLSVAASTRVWGEGASAWDVLVVTGLGARRWVRQMRSETLRRVWFDHVVFSVLRLGLAVGIAEALHMDNGACYHYGFSLFCYGSFFNPSVSLAPEIAKLVIAGAVLVGFAFLEAYLLTALGLLAQILIVRGTLALRLGLSLVARAMLVGGIVVIWSSLIPLIYTTTFRSDSYCYFASICYQYSRRGTGGEDILAESRAMSDRVLLANTLEPLFIGITPLGDNATMLTADMLRPSYGVIATIRNIPHIIIGAGLYWVIIRLLIWSATRLAIQRGMLP